MNKGTIMRTHEGMRAIVTGAARGVGLATAEKLARNGASVALCDIDGPAVNEAAARLSEEGLSVEPIVLDVADSGDVRGWFASVDRIDILVNNAGVAQQVSPIAELPDDEWERVLQVNLTGTFYCSRAAARLMRNQARGSIVNVSSINGLSSAAFVGAYNASKAAIIS